MYKRQDDDDVHRKEWTEGDISTTSLMQVGANMVETEKAFNDQGLIIHKNHDRLGAWRCTVYVCCMDPKYRPSQAKSNASAKAILG